MMTSATVQRQMVLAKRKMNVSRAVTGLVEGPSTVAAMGDHYQETAAICPQFLTKSPAIGRDFAEVERLSNLKTVSKTMPAVVKSRSEPGLELQEVPIPEVGPNEV